MHIVYLAGSLHHISGGVRVITEHANGLIARGHTVEIWVRGGNLTQYFTCEAKVYSLDPTALDKPDIVVMTDPVDIAEVAKYRGKRTSYLLMQHDNEWLAQISGEPSMMRGVVEHIDFFLSKAWGIIAVSTWVKQVIADRYGIVCDTVLNGVNTDIFHPTKPLLNSPTQKILIYYSPQNWKGFPEGVSAALEVKETNPEVEIVFMGGILLGFPDENPAYRHFSFPATAFNIPDQNTMASIYSSATVFVSASWKEGFGMPGLEALACGVPLVTTDSEGIREYAKHDKTAIIVPVGDVPAIADGIRTVLNDQRLQRKLSRNGLQEAKKFTWDESINKLEEILKAR